MELEIFKDIEGYEGLYQISNLGNVKSLARECQYVNVHRISHIPERILKPCVDGWGYQFVILQNKGKTKMYKIHRLVAQAFIPNPDNLPCVNHKDECKTNNMVDNLEWCDYKYNNNYGTRKERIKAEKYTKELEEKIKSELLEFIFSI